MKKNFSDLLKESKNLLQDYGAHFYGFLLLYRKKKFDEILKTIEENPIPTVEEHFANEPNQKEVKKMFMEEKKRIDKLNKLAVLLNEVETEKNFRETIIEANKVIYGEDSPCPF